MKIGILLRHYDQHPGGVKNYTDNLLERLLPLGKDDEFVLIYKNPNLIGCYAKFPNVREIAYRAPALLIWDQIIVPWIERKEKFDVLFNPKWSMPIFVQAPQIFVCHGLDWYVMPWGSPPLDRLSHRFLIPRIAKNARSIICVSRHTAHDTKRFLGISGSKLRVIYHGIGDSFLQPFNEERTNSIASKYDLPGRYLLYVGGIYPAKNFDRLIRAYAEVKDELGIPLVIAGQHTFMCEDHLNLPEKLGISELVHFVGWIGHDELPVFYKNATALVLPSLYEACPSPILEAMAVGCPVLTGNRTGMSEIAGGAAFEVNPDSVTSIAHGMREITNNSAIRERLVTAGRIRAKQFSWEECAKHTYQAIHDVPSQTKKGK